MTVYQPIVNSLGLIGEKKINYGIVWKSKSLFKSKLPLHGANKN